MDLNAKDYQRDLIARICDTFPEIDGGIAVGLRKTDENYAALWRETLKLQEDCPAIVKVLEGSGGASLSADEHRTFLRYLGLKRRMEDAERLHIYFRGHMDGFAYLKRIGAI
jgi:hypothetical protein